MGEITSFRGNYAFLSNFWECDVEYDGYTFRNSEAAYQADKTESVEEKFRFATMKPSIAKKAGRTVKMRDGFEEEKNKIMQRVVVCKFMQNPSLMSKLLATGNARLVEGNTWHDNYWGVCTCGRKSCSGGKNVLGKILMQVRDTYIKDKSILDSMNEEYRYHNE